MPQAFLHTLCMQAHDISTGYGILQPVRGTSGVGCAAQPGVSIFNIRPFQIVADGWTSYEIFPYICTRVY